MKINWIENYYEILKSHAINCNIIRRMHGWIETIDIEDNLYYTKSKTYDSKRREYFIGVDSKKPLEDCDFTLICGGESRKIRDLFIIPWDIYITTLKEGEAINTYKLPKEYFQFKSYIRHREKDWYLSVLGGQRPRINISQYRYNLNDSIKFFKI